jgi:CelD/BcsL family acetyltransferase involved in cellulose biosynthesis
MYMGERAVAFVLGFQYRGVFHYSDVAYDEEFAGLSPGSVLLFLLLEDLFGHCRPSILHFGIGEADYKRRFSNFKEYDNEVLLMRSGLMATCFRMNAFMRAKGKSVGENLRRDMEEPSTNEADESSREPSRPRRET